MKRVFVIIIAVCFLITAFAGCESTAPAQTKSTSETSAQKADSSEASAKSGNASAGDKNEKYILVTALSTYDMFKSNDFAAFEQWGKERGVTTQIAGPAEWDMAACASAIDQAAAQKPAGLLIAGFDPTLKAAIDNAVNQGIPVVTYDSDVPDSKRLAFSGTNWSEIGRIQALALGEAMGGKGKVAYIGIVGMNIMEEAFAAFEKTMKDKYPNVVLLNKFNNPASVEEAAKVASDIISANPDLTGMAGFTSQAGPGMGIAIKEANKVGKIKLTCVDIEPQHLKLVEDGIATLLVGQKRRLFTYNGAEMLFDYVHKSNSFSNDDKAAGISTIPAKVDTGLILVDKNNIKYFKK